MNRAETAKLLALMRTVWDDTSGADAVDKLNAYSMMLADVSYDEAEAAFVTCGRDPAMRFFPKPGELIERLPSVQRFRRMSSPDADLKYILSEIIGNAVGLGLYDASSGRIRKPESFPNPIMAEAVRLFGWGRILDADREWLPREWEKVWNQARETVTKQFIAGDLVLDAEGLALPAGEKPVVLAEVKSLAAQKAMGS